MKLSSLRREGWWLQEDKPPSRNVFCVTRSTNVTNWSCGDFILCFDVCNFKHKVRLPERLKMKIYLHKYCTIRGLNSARGHARCI
jgi:hypothetical protein